MEAAGAVAWKGWERIAAETNFSATHAGRGRTRKRSIVRVLPMLLVSDARLSINGLLCPECCPREIYYELQKPSSLWLADTQGGKKYQFPTG